MPNPEQAAQQNQNEQIENLEAPNPVTVEDYRENLSFVENVRDAQKTKEDFIWNTFEYHAKNEFQQMGEDLTEDQRQRYGFNPSGMAEEEEEQFLNQLNQTIREDARSWNAETFKNVFRSMGSMNTRITILNGKQYDMIRQALGEGTPNLEDKAYSLFYQGGFTNFGSAFNVQFAAVNSELKNGLEELLDRTFDYKTVTLRQVADFMGIDYNRLTQLPPQDGDRLYSRAKRLSPNFTEGQLKNDTLQSLSTMIATYYTTQGVELETARLTEEQRRLLEAGQYAGRLFDTVNLNEIQDWIATEGNAIGAKLNDTVLISSMKQRRLNTQLSGSINYNAPGWLDRKLQDAEAQFKFVADVVRGTKDIEAVKQEIINKANQKFFEESLRKYPKKVRAEANYDNYITLHTGSRAGKSPEQLVENLAKSLAAASLKERGVPFNRSKIQSTAKYFKELFALDALKSRPEVLNGALQGRSAVLRTGRHLKKTLYGVPAEKQNSYCSQMQALRDNLLPPEGRSKEYQKFYQAVTAAAALGQSQAGKSPVERARAFTQANMNVFEAAVKYMDGKEILRFKDSGKISFDHCLDAMAICTETSPALSVRTDKIIRNINRIRNHNDFNAADYIDAEHLRDNYGAAHSARRPEDYNGPAPLPQQRRPKVNAAVEDVHAPAVPADPSKAKVNNPAPDLHSPTVGPEPQIRPKVNNPAPDLRSPTVGPEPQFHH